MQKFSKPFLAPQTVSLASHRLVAEGIDDAGFLDAVRPIAEQHSSAVLLSGRDLDCSRYSLAAWDPLAILKSKGQKVHLWTSENQWHFDCDPLTCLDAVMAAFQPDYPLGGHPFAGGAIGYFAYDLKNTIEKLPQTVEDDLQLPDMLLFYPRRILIHHRHEGKLYELHLRWGTISHDEPCQSLGWIRQRRRSSSPSLRLGALSSNFSHPDYLKAVRRIRDYIRAGDVYQVNLSQRFTFPFQGSPLRLWEHLYELNPAPFYAFLELGDHQVLSTSMERFLFRRGPRIETRPIKGTRKRGATPDEDRLLQMDLQRNPKDDAELSMIVDLLRNDLGRVCQPRSVRVTEHKRIESYQNVHHLVSIVTGTLPDDATTGEVLRATFPGGSITGCPKIRAMEIIDELEPLVRHVYTGAIGYLGWHANMDLNIAIRTALVRRNVCSFSVGGGIVFDSDEEDEYQETLHKARTLFDVMENLERMHDAR